MTLKAPFPYFGGKSRVAHLVWERFGDVPNYVEPFAGSLAVLLGRPGTHLRKDGLWPTETVNDLDGFVSNAWRAILHDPEATAHAADWPVNECDLHARHLWLVRHREELSSRLMADPDYFDAKTAGWWLWGIACWIGSGWCSGDGPWTEDGGLFILGSAGTGVNKKLPHLGDAGRGVNKKRNASAWLSALSDRLHRVRVCCGDWMRVTGDSVTIAHGTTGVMLDPPYADTADRNGNIYAKDSMSVAHDVRQWAIEHGDDPRLRIALCGYEGEHAMPEDWDKVAWKAPGGYGSQGTGRGRDNATKERIWFSPHCLKPGEGQMGLFTQNPQQ